MTESLLCFLCFLVAILGVGFFIYLGKSCSAQKGQTLSVAMDSYVRAKTWDQKLAFFVFNIILLLKAGFWGFLAVVSVSVLSTVSAICGLNPWPYYFEAWDRFVCFWEDWTSTDCATPVPTQ
jgi:hypothetical protein